MGIIIREGGLYTTVQDLGRIGYQDLGFSVCGAMDKNSLKIANMLVNNKDNEACLEVTLVGPILEFTKNNIIAITGGNLQPKLNEIKVDMNKAIVVKKGDILSFESAIDGARSYISFSGGLDIPTIMGSKSTNVKCSIGGYNGRTLKKGDFIKFKSPKEYIPNFASKNIINNETYGNKVILRVILGPQDDAFTNEGLNTFLSSTYKVTKEFDRMGCRLNGPEIEHKKQADIISDGIVLGSIQVPSHGKPIIMLTDRQTTGGYTKIGTVISVDICKLAQCKTGDIINFKQISLEEAQVLYKEEYFKFEEIRKQINKPCVEILNPRVTSIKIEKLLIKGRLNNGI
ncbi:biotin-dependent carboxyltransferase family protein [Romboutsia sp. Marseille-P6047]|uniref:5-oxoprolinase subunit C family protein n=1 Tax=Romboutsia sp. Marseille-P6047 TaxID=2161817 RepID=UPI000821BFE4|nr:biotin-dependent carboxyltransferase family protein [Romboutsia sp. Marseille-P6047]SCH66354.1 Allophanate hydrolase subunit 2 [uncultured Clostridium sp.]